MRLNIRKQTIICLSACFWLAGQSLAQPLSASVSGGATGDDVVQLEGLNVSGLREKGFVPKSSAVGTKSVVPLVEAPQSISVITADQMALQGARGLDDAVKYSSGVIGNPYGYDPRTDWLFVRGFQPTRYIDGLAMPDGVWTGVTRWDPYGFERVEVLKGASSALYGTMPVGGLVNASTKRPTLQAFGEISAGVGSFEQLHASLDAGGPLNAGKSLLYRLTASVRAGDSVLDYSKDNRQFIAPAFTWVINPDTYITFLARYQRDTSRGLLGFLPAEGTIDPNPNGTLSIKRYTGEPDFDYYDKELWSFGYEAEHRFGAKREWYVRQNLRVVGASVDQALVGGLGLDVDMRTLNRYSWTPHETSHGIAVDTQIGGKHVLNEIENNLLGGLDYRHGSNNAVSGMGFGVAPLDIFNPVYGAAITRPADSSHTYQTQSQFGIYVQDRIKWRGAILTLGARQDFVSLKTEDRMAHTSQKRSDSRLSGRVGLGYLFDFGLTPYVAWSTSFQPNLGTSYSGDSFSPTTGSLLEAGLKYQPRADAARAIDALFTVAAYQSSLKNILTTDTSAPVFGYSLQQGKTRVRGIEVEARATPLKGLGVIAAYTYTDSEIRETSVVTDLGKQIPLVPRNRVSLWGDYTLSAGVLRNLGFGLGVTYNSAVYGDSSNVYKGNSATLWDAVVHYDLDTHWRFQITATNVFDKRYVSAVQSSMWAFYGNPRVVTGSVTYKF